MKPLNFDFMRERLGIVSQKDEYIGQCERCGKDVYKHEIFYKDGRVVEKESGCECQARIDAIKDLEKKRIAEYERYSVINPEYKTKRVNAYEARNETQRIAKVNVINFIKNHVKALEKGQGMILMGAFGTGKTHLAAAIRNALVENDKRVLFISFPDYLDVIKQGFGKHGQADQRYAQVSYKTQELAKKADLLVLDDVGANSMTDWAKEQLFLLINSRIGKSTIVTTNYRTQDFEKDRELHRSFSRMSELSPIIEIEGDDLRRLKGAFNYG